MDYIEGLEAGLEDHDCDVVNVEVDEGVRLVSHVGAKVSADNALPRRPVLPVQFLLDVRRNIL